MNTSGKLPLSKDPFGGGAFDEERLAVNGIHLWINWRAQKG